MSAVSCAHRHSKPRASGGRVTKLIPRLSTRSKTAQSPTSSPSRKRPGCSRLPTANPAASRGTSTSWNGSTTSSPMPANARSSFRQAARNRAVLLRLTGKLGTYKPHPMIEHFKFLRNHTKRTPKMTIPSPSSLHFRYGRDAVPETLYPAMEDFYRDLGQSYRKVVRAFADAGCCYLQLDEVNLAYLCDPSLRKAIADYDQCRDRRHSLRHDDHHASVPRQFSLQFRRQRWLRTGGRASLQHN